jgi:hypothetical protein
MTIAEQVYAIVASLPEDQAKEGLTFAQFIGAKHLNPDQSMTTTDTMPWAELIESLSGAWKNDFPSLEDIRAGSGQDILRERL